MNAVLADRAAALEVERAQPTPRRPKPDLNAPVPPHEQARHRTELLNAVYGNTRKADQS